MLSRSAPVAPQACGRCTLRLAGVQDAAAYADSGLPVSAAGVLRRLESSRIPFKCEPAAEEEDQGGTKRRRLDEAGTAAAGAAEEGPPAAAAALGAPANAADADAGEQAGVVCPLCLGLLQAAEPAQGATDSPTPQLSGCTLELVTTTSTLNDPQRCAAFGFGTKNAAAATAAIAAGDEQGQGIGSGAGTSSATPAAVVTLRAAPMPSLAAVAAAVSAEFDFDCFALEVSVPASLAVRQQALSWRLRQAEGPRERAESLAGALGEAGPDEAWLAGRRGGGCVCGGGGGIV